MSKEIRVFYLSAVDHVAPTNNANSERHLRSIFIRLGFDVLDNLCYNNLLDFPGSIRRGWQFQRSENKLRSFLELFAVAIFILNF